MDEGRYRVLRSWPAQRIARRSERAAMGQIGSSSIWPVLDSAARLSDAKDSEAAEVIANLYFPSAIAIPASASGAIIA